MAPKDYSPFDRPEILNYLFHPRGDFTGTPQTATLIPLSFDVDKDVSIGATFHHHDKAAPVILFFHGNGEIVSDYDDLGPVFGQIGLNFFPVDYRGYGRSTGSPSVSAMMNDSHILFDKTRNWLKENQYTGPLIIMGRSLGSASAIEIASTHSEEIAALIVESGFAFIMPLLRLLGIPTDLPGLTEETGPENNKKIRDCHCPTLIIHAEYDHIIPLSDGRTLYSNAGARSKKLIEIKGADHNNIFAVGLSEYLRGVKAIADEAARK